MKNYIIATAIASLCVSCEQKSTTINPPGEKETTVIKESPTTIVKEAPNTTEKKTETETKITPGGTTIEKKETTEQR